MKKQSFSIFICISERKLQTVIMLYDIVALHYQLNTMPILAHIAPIVHPLTSRASLMKKMGVLLPVKSQLPSSE